MQGLGLCGDMIKALGVLSWKAFVRPAANDAEAPKNRQGCDCQASYHHIQQGFIRALRSRFRV